MKRKLLLICGVSGSGKTYIEKLLVESNEGYKFNKLNQVTTRLPRNLEEVNNRVYTFLDHDLYDILDSTDILTAKTNVNGNRYGTILNLKEDHINTVIVNSNGIKDIIHFIHRNKLDIDVFTICIDSDVLERREGRNDDFLEKERQELSEYYDLLLKNNADDRLNAKKVIDALKDNGFLD